MADRFFILRFVSFKALGIYALAYKLGSAIRQFLVMPFILAWGPFMFSTAKEENGLAVISRSGTVFFVVGLSAVVGVSIYGIDIIRLLASPNYFIAYKYVPFIAAGCFLYGVAHIFRSGILLSGKTERFSIIMFVGMACNLIVNYLFVPSLEVWGACLAFLLTILFVTILSYLQGHKLLKIDFEVGVQLKLLLLAGLVITGSVLLNFPSLALDAAWKSLLFLLYLLVVFALKIVTLDQAKRGLESFRMAVNR